LKCAVTLYVLSTCLGLTYSSSANFVTCSTPHHVIDFMIPEPVVSPLRVLEQTLVVYCHTAF